MTYSKFDCTGETFQSRLDLSVLYILKPAPQLCKYRIKTLIPPGAGTGAGLLLFFLMPAYA